MTTTHQQAARDPPHPHRAGRYDWITFLVTGPNAKLLAWQFAAMSVVQLFELRGQTVRCRAHGDPADRGQRAYERAVELAQRLDVTLQDLVDGDPRENASTHQVGAASVTVAACVEEYPVVHLGSDGMLWPDYLPKTKRQGALQGNCGLKSNSLQ